MPHNLDMRLLRSFVAAAEELHFSRAAARLYLAQQALSRHIRELEQHLGMSLFDRTTRRVTLTPAGERLLPGARQLLELHDALLADVRGQDRPLLVDCLGEGLTPTLVLDTARGLASSRELIARFGGGMGAALPQLTAHAIDVAFARSEGLGVPFPGHCARRLVRLEPLGILVPAEHRFAGLTAVPLSELRGHEVDVSLGNPAAPEWVELALQLFDSTGLVASEAHHPAQGSRETAHHLHAQARPILVMTTSPPVSAAVIRPLIDPVPLYPWAMTHRRDLRHPGLDALHAAIDDLVQTHSWLEVPDGAWIPAQDAAVFALR